MATTKVQQGERVRVTTDAGTERGTVQAVRQMGYGTVQVDVRFDDDTYCWVRPEQVEAMATPRPGTVRDAYGDPCQRATKASYPLTARCDHCSADVRCADGTAAWAHKRSGSGFCQ